MPLEYLEACIIGETSDDPEERKKGLKVFKNKIEGSSNADYDLVGSITDMISYYKSDMKPDSVMHYAGRAFSLIEKNPDLTNSIEFLGTKTPGGISISVA